MKQIFITNRKKIYDTLEDNSILILFAGTAPVEAGDQNYYFVPDMNFYYMTGIDAEDVIFLAHKQDDSVDERLFIPRFDKEQAKWVTSLISKGECTSVSGISNVYFADEFYTNLSELLFKTRTEAIYLNLEKREWGRGVTSGVTLANEIKEKYPYISIKNIYGEFSEVRLIKSGFEVDNIKKAIEITKEGLYLMIKNCSPGMIEYEIEAYFDFALKKNGVTSRAFATIAASGENATILHYSDNNRRTNDNDLILVDLGAQYKHYKADITRTFPVGGKFTERQKIIYNIVLEGQKKVIEFIKPGTEFTELTKILKQYYCAELKKIGLIKKDKELEKYFYHGVSHMLGLETHDIGRSHEGVLKPGMVLTVEPGLYIKEERTGIRIEDVVLVTDAGCEVLSDDIIKTVNDIELFMRR